MPAFLTARPLKLATPLTAFTVAVPISVAPAVPDVSVSVTGCAAALERARPYTRQVTRYCQPPFFATVAAIRASLLVPEAGDE